MKLITPDTDKRCPPDTVYLVNIDPRNVADVKEILEAAKRDYRRRHGRDPNGT